MQFQIPHNNHKILFQQDAVKSPLLEFYQFGKENQRKIVILDIEGTCIFLESSRTEMIEVRGQKVIYI